jgi:hypothetical protein
MHALMLALPSVGETARISNRVCRVYLCVTSRQLGVGHATVATAEVAVSLEEGTVLGLLQT